MKKLPNPKSKYGYSQKELDGILTRLKIDRERFYKVFGVNTVVIIKGKPRYYKCDIERAFWYMGEKLGIPHSWD